MAAYLPMNGAIVAAIYFFYLSQLNRTQYSLTPMAATIAAYRQFSRAVAIIW